ncbi:MAG: hypothetical protein ACFFCW_13620 [Candidatus Hodarchaeota archaeon]
MIQLGPTERCPKCGDWMQKFQEKGHIFNSCWRCEDPEALEEMLEEAGLV